MQTVQTQIRLLLQEQSDLGLHCLTKQTAFVVIVALKIRPKYARHTPAADVKGARVSNLARKLAEGRAKTYVSAND